MRLADYLSQIDVTWDLYLLTPEELLWRLPKEFEDFYQPRAVGRRLPKRTCLSRLPP